MKKISLKNLWASVICLTAFVLWTLAVCVFDRAPIGPEGSVVGLAAINEVFYELTGVHLWLYDLTDRLSILPLLVIFGFAVLGLLQLIKRKSLFKVDFSILALGGFYIVVLALYLLFEVVVINFRPVLIEGVLEASYPSSTTMLMLTVMPTAALQMNRLLKKGILKKCVLVLIVCFTAFMVLGRLVSGVHWLSDIIGGGLLSCGLVLLYRFVLGFENHSV